MLPWMIQRMSHHEEDSQWIAFECSNALFFNWLCSQIFGGFSFENNEMLLLQWLHLLSSSSEVFFVTTFLLGISSFLPFLWQQLNFGFFSRLKNVIHLDKYIFPSCIRNLWLWSFSAGSCLSCCARLTQQQPKRERTISSLKRNLSHSLKKQCWLVALNNQLNDSKPKLTPRKAELHEHCWSVSFTFTS